MNYFIRTKTGEAKARLTGSKTKQLFDRLPGHFREAKFEKGPQTVFELDDDIAWVVPGGQAEILLWKGDTICPEA
jgi:hypothetical protein